MKHLEKGFLGFPGGAVSEESVCNAGDPGSIPGSERSLGEGNGNPLQSSCLENPMDRGGWQATFQGVGRVGHDWANKPTYLSPSIRVMVEGRMAGAQYCQVLPGGGQQRAFLKQVQWEAWLSSPSLPSFQTWEPPTPPADECERVGVPGYWARWCWDGFHSLPKVDD